MQISSSANLNPREGPMQSRQGLVLEDKEAFGMKKQQAWHLQLQVFFSSNTDLVHPTAGFLY